MDSSWYKIYIDRPMLNKKVLNPVGGLPYSVDNVEPPGICDNVKMAIPSRKTSYGIAWSDDGKRFAFISRGWLIAAYDLSTGEKTEHQIGNKENALRTHNQINNFLEGKPQQ